jgi:hypothetical protein
MGEHLPIVLIEVVLIFGGVLAFGCWCGTIAARNCCGCWATKC